METNKIKKVNEIRAELIRRGITLSDIARICQTSKQQVHLAIRANPKKGKQLEILKKIMELIS